MLFMNDYDIARAQHRFSGNPNLPNLGEAADTLAALADWANDNSDGWPYWSAPSRAAQKLQGALNDAAMQYLRGGTVTDLTPAQLAAALRPVRAFLTRQGVSLAAIL